MKHKANSEVFGSDCLHSMLASGWIPRQDIQGTHPLKIRMNVQQVGTCINQSVVSIKLKPIKYALNIKENVLIHIIHKLNKIINDRFFPNFLFCHAQHVNFSYLESKDAFSSSKDHTFIQ